MDDHFSVSFTEMRQLPIPTELNLKGKYLGPLSIYLKGMFNLLEDLEVGWVYKRKDHV